MHVEQGKKEKEKEKSHTKDVLSIKDLIKTEFPGLQEMSPRTSARKSF